MYHLSEISDTTCVVAIVQNNVIVSMFDAFKHHRLLPLGFKIEVSVNVAGTVFNSTCTNKFSKTDSKDYEVFEMQMVATQCPGGRGVFNTI